jgi:5'(3')-deoxyribonucleotidase
MGLGPMERRATREYIVGQFFACVGDKQVVDLDVFMKKNKLQEFHFKGVSYHNSNTISSPFYHPLQEDLHEEFNKYLRVYKGLDMEMASLSSLLTRLFRKCNSLKDMDAVLPDVLKPFVNSMEISDPPAEDYLTQYITQPDIDKLWADNHNEISQLKVRAMRDEVFR